MFNLFSSGNKYQQLARRENAQLTEANGIWYLYRDGILIARDKHPWNACQALFHR